MGYDYIYPFRLIRDKILAKTARLKYDIAFRRNVRQSVSRVKLAGEKAVFLVMTPDHQNLGDHAIAMAERQLLEKHGIYCEEITCFRLEEMAQKGLLKAMNGYPILFNGGGNMGTLWFGVEELQRKVIQSNPKSKIMVLPNTVYYENSPWGKEELEKSARIYGKHPQLYLYAREKKSYELMKSVYRNVKLVPDMVFALQIPEQNCQRSGCLVCLRTDREQTLTQEGQQQIYTELRSLFGDQVRQTDTVLAYHVNPEDRETALKEKLAEFASASLVITDRLHGMVFCAITGTPCIVLGSKSPKLRGCYEWIRNLQYIRFAEEPSQIPQMYRMICTQETTYDVEHLLPLYEELAEDIKTVMGWR